MTAIAAVNTNLSMPSSMLQVALADLLQFNPSADVNGPVAPGTSLTRPCYPANEEPTYLGMQPLCVGRSGSLSMQWPS